MGEQVLSSLPLEILLFFNKTFAWLFFVLELVVFLYKGSTFLYASGVFGVEFFFLFVYLALELARIFQASKGNKVEQIGPLLWSVVLSVGVVILHVFFFNMQTYVLKVDRILNGMGIVFIALESLLMLLTSLTFYRERQ